MIKVGEKCKIYIEKPDGELIEMTSIVEGYSITQSLAEVTAMGDREQSYIPTSSSVKMKIDLCGIGPLITTTGKNISSSARNSKEWKCDYCGRPNKRERETCESCGSVRSFIYG
jgi:hypothetical protein